MLITSPIDIIAKRLSPSPLIYCLQFYAEKEPCKALQILAIQRGLVSH